MGTFSAGGLGSGSLTLTSLGERERDLYGDGARARALSGAGDAVLTRSCAVSGRNGEGVRASGWAAGGGLSLGTYGRCGRSGSSSGLMRPEGRCRGFFLRRRWLRRGLQWLQHGLRSIDLECIG